MATWGMYSHGQTKLTKKSIRWRKYMEKKQELKAISYLHPEMELLRLKRIEILNKKIKRLLK